MMLIKIIFTFFSILISRADIKTGEVPRIAFIFAFPFFIILKLLLKEKNYFIESILGVLTGLLVFLFVYFFSGKRLGLADVWYSALIGLVIGLWCWYAAIGLACVAGIFYIRTVKQRKIPFIPFMALGSLIINIIRGKYL